MLTVLPISTLFAQTFSDGQGNNESDVNFFIGTGVYQEYIPFKNTAADTYNAYIYRFFRNEGASLFGQKFMVGIRLPEGFMQRTLSEAIYTIIPSLEISLETFSASASLPYKTLLNENRENKISVSYYQLLLTSVYSLNDGNSFNHAIKLGLGTGLNQLTRKFYGTVNDKITAESVNDVKNQGTDGSTTNATYLMYQLGYRIKFAAISADFNYGYKLGSHLISKSDPRPARNKKNLFAESIFFTESYFYNIQLAVIF